MHRSIWRWAALTDKFMPPFIHIARLIGNTDMANFDLYSFTMWEASMRLSAVGTPMGRSLLGFSGPSLYKQNR